MSKALPDILAACLRRDRTAQKLLYEQFAPRMYALCYRYARDRSEAEDMLQEGFIKVFAKLADYADRGNFEGWMRRIMVNTAIDHLRKHHPERFASETEVHNTPGDQADAIDHMALEELLEVIQGLPDGYRLVFNLYAIEGYRHAEIGKMLEISESTSRSQYTRARALLQERLQQIDDQPKIYQDAC